MIISPSVLRTPTKLPLGRPWIWRCGTGLSLAAAVGSAFIAQQGAVSTPAMAYELAVPALPVLSSSLDPAAEAQPMPSPLAAIPTAAAVPVELLPEPVARPVEPMLPDLRDMILRHRREVGQARASVIELERGIAAVDQSIAALAAAAADARRVEITAGPESEAVARARSAYADAIGRERRAAALAAHGIPARQELEAAQVQVREAAAALAAARAAAEQAETLSAAKALRARAEAEIALAEQQQRRAEFINQLGEARRRLRAAQEAEAAIAAAR